MQLYPRGSPAGTAVRRRPTWTLSPSLSTLRYTRSPSAREPATAIRSLRRSPDGGRRRQLPRPHSAPSREARGHPSPDHHAGNMRLHSMQVRLCMPARTERRGVPSRGRTCPSLNLSPLPLSVSTAEVRASLGLGCSSSSEGACARDVRAPARVPASGAWWAAGLWRHEVCASSIGAALPCPPN